MKIQANGIDVHYEMAGEGDCLILIHGFSDNLSLWYNQVPEFSKQYQVLTLDVRGHGQTETPDGEFSINLFAEDVRELLNALQIEKACVLGYSMGGRIALQLALNHPESVTGLVFANSGIAGAGYQMSEEQMKEMTERRQQMIEMFDTGDIERIADTMTERSMSPGIRDAKPALFQRYKEIKMQNSPRYYTPIMQAMMASAADPPDLGQIKCPVLIIAGERDEFMPLDIAEYMKKTLHKASLEVFPTGHASALETPKEFNRAVLDFMEQL
jgi:2-succinyl-6-hydroxy-2,4-cyclohexadiene-1-carboxylate synthase